MSTGIGCSKKEVDKTDLKRSSQKVKEDGKQKKVNKKISFERNYWVEYWDEVAERWICKCSQFISRKC